jgi:hypothetical protein
MPTLKNPRHERFAQFIALGTMSRAEAFRQAGFKAKRADQGAYELVRRPEIASRINTLREEATQPTGHRSIQAITRQELAELLGKIVRAGFSKPELAKPYEALKAAELLAKMQGYNEPDKSVHNHVQPASRRCADRGASLRVFGACPAECESLLAFAKWVRCSCAARG